VVEPYTLDVPRRADPYPYYAELRREEPVHYSPVEDIWVLTRFDDCMAAFSDPHVWSSQRRGNLLNDLPERIGRTLGTTDPPRHTFARRLVNKAFTPRTVAGLEPLIRGESAALHDAACAKGTFEYVHDISAPLNARILGAMFGVPESEFLRVRGWLDDFFVRDKPEPGREPRQVVAMRELRAYVDTLVEARLQDPGDDLMSAMLAAREDGESLTHEQVAVTTMTFLTAGFESTNNLFTNMVHALAEVPDIHARLRADPSAPPTATPTPSPTPIASTSTGPAAGTSASVTAPTSASARRSGGCSHGWPSRTSSPVPARWPSTWTAPYASARPTSVASSAST